MIAGQRNKQQNRPLAAEHFRHSMHPEADGHTPSPDREIVGANGHMIAKAASRGTAARRVPFFVAPVQSLCAVRGSDRARLPGTEQNPPLVSESSWMIRQESGVAAEESVWPSEKSRSVLLAANDERDMQW